MLQRLNPRALRKRKKYIPGFRKEEIPIPQGDYLLFDFENNLESHDQTITLTPQFGSSIQYWPGKVNQSAYQLNGTRFFLDKDDPGINLFFDWSTPKAISAWVWIQSGVTYYIYVRDVLSINTALASANVWGLVFRNNSVGFYGSSFQQTFSSSLSTGWHFIYFRYDPANNRLIRFGRDAESELTINHTGTLSYPSYDPILRLTIATNNTTQIAFDQVAIWHSVVVSRQDMLDIYNGGIGYDIITEQPAIPPQSDYSNLVLAGSPTVYYRFFDLGLDLISETGSFDGRFNTAPGQTNSLYSDTLGARNYTGGNLSYNTSGTINVANGFSIELVFSTSGVNQGLCGFSNQTTGAGTLHDKGLTIDGTGKLSYYYSGGGDNYLVSPLSYNDGNPHYVVVVHTANAPKLYVDGALVATGTGNAGTFSLRVRTGYEGKSATYLTGIIDEYVFSQAEELTPTQISDRYTALTT